MTEKELIAAISGHKINGLKVDEGLTVKQLELILEGNESKAKNEDLEKELDEDKSDETHKAATEANEALSNKVAELEA